MAHVWVEAFISGKGWVRVDPSSFAQNAGVVWGGSSKRGLLHNFRMAVDSLNHRWDSMVVTYDFERQVNAARGAGKLLQRIEARTVFRSVLPYLLLLAGLAGLCCGMVYRKRLFPSREERLLRALYRRVEQDFSLKVERGRVGMFELADRTGNPGVRLFAETYTGAVYRDRPLTDEECVRLKNILEQIQKTSEESNFRRSGGAGM